MKNGFNQVINVRHVTNYLQMTIRDYDHITGKYRVVVHSDFNNNL